MGIKDFFRKGREEPVPEKKPIEAPEPAAPKMHTVQSGESLSLIAKKYYNDPLKWDAIYQANKDRIKDPDVIHPGWELTIPEISPNTDNRVHVVASGESLSLIAKKYYGDPMKWNAIYEANKDKISNPDVIRPGQELVIPLI